MGIAMILAFRAVLLVAALLALTACSGQVEELGVQELVFDEPETTIDYEVELKGAPDDETAALLEESLGLYRFRDRGAQSVAFLRRRAEKDAEIARKILRSRGYYEGTIATRITMVETPEAAAAAAPVPAGDGAPQDPDEAVAGRASPNAAAPASAAAAGKAKAVAHVIVKPGRPFKLVAHRFVVIDQGDGPPPQPPAPESLGSPVGKPAAAAPILAAESAAVAALRENGRPYASFRGRRAVADMERAELEVESTIASGPLYRYGDLSFEGLKDVDEAYLRTYRTWEDGAPVNPNDLRDYQRELMGTNLFNAGAVRIPEDPPEGHSAPVLVTLEEGPPQTVTAGLQFSTDRGPEGRASYTHRNLFGANETFEALLDLGFQDQRLSGQLRKPQYLRHGQDLLGGVVLKHVNEDAFEERALTATLGLERRIDDRLTVGLGGLLEISQVDDLGVRQDVQLAGIPIFARYDESNDKLNPTQGWRADFFGTPYLGLTDGVAATFLSLDARSSAYWDLLDDGRYVLAGRGRMGSILSSSFADIPASRRLYSGGGGSIRGYREKFIGPLDAVGDPVGGRSVIEAGVELRAKVYGDIGVVGFVEGGSVSTSIAPDFQEGMQFAAGFGARYYSPVGPLRVDLAFPLNPREEDDAFQFYISIGQAY